MEGRWEFRARDSARPTARNSAGRKEVREVHVRWC